MKRRTASVIGAAAFCCALPALAASSPPLGLKGALESEHIGLLPAENFRLSSGKCADCTTIKQGLWYFESELLALPKTGQAVTDFSPEADRFDDVRRWAAGEESRQLAYPSLVWLGSPHILEGASILPGGTQIRISDGTLVDLKLVPKLSTNR